uniref:Uncharacterized protein n=1 Tax=Amphiprion percula TaxID=161767 RepID=A0A3P8SLT9_AMPPE
MDTYIPSLSSSTTIPSKEQTRASLPLLSIEAFTEPSKAEGGWWFGFRGGPELRKEERLSERSIKREKYQVEEIWGNGMLMSPLCIQRAWLDKMTMQRLKELNHLSKEEAERIRRLRSEVGSPTQWAERAEQIARERIQPLLDEAQQIGESRTRIDSSLRNRLSEQAAERAAESAERLSEALLEDLLEDTAQVAWVAETDRQLQAMAQCRLQAPTLENMLLRMEEIQRDQEEVRRRFASITYSDPLYWDRPGAAGSQCRAPGSRPASPQPIRLTRPVLKQTSAADIVLEKPIETGNSLLFENSLTEEAPQDQRQPRNSTMFPGTEDRHRRTVISVLGSMLGNIRRYREDYEAYLRVVAHEAVGSFNPWAVADSLAEELLSEAVGDVAAEFQDVVEEYAEAVFTSEFLQPVQSPPTLVSQ